MATYLLSIFDDDPASSCEGAWPSHDGLEIEASSDEEALDEASDLLDVEAVGLNRADGYTVGQTLFAQVTGPDEMIVGTPTLTLTEEHLGSEGPMSKGDVDQWEAVACAVSVFEGGACDVSIEVGGAESRWYVRTTDDAGGSDEGPKEAFSSYDEAVEAAEELAAALDEGDGYMNAGEYLAAALEEAAGEPVEDGEFAVYWDWESACAEDEGPRERYDSLEAAQAAAKIRNAGLRQHNPGGNLLCGFSVRVLSGGEWVACDEVAA